MNFQKSSLCFEKCSVKFLRCDVLKRIIFEKLVAHSAHRASQKSFRKMFYEDRLSLREFFSLHSV